MIEIKTLSGRVLYTAESLEGDGDEGVFRASVALVWVDQWVESRKQITTASIVA